MNESIIISDKVREQITAKAVLVGLGIQIRQLGILKIIEKEAPDLLIVDLDIPYADELRVFDRLQDVNQSIPLLVHNLPSGDTTNSFIQRAAGFVEKDGNNITNLKDTITQVLRKHYPHRF